MTATRYEHAGAAAPTALAADIDDSDTTITIASATGWPTGGVGPFVITIAAGTASEEKVLVESRTGTTLTVSDRGFDDTTAVAHLEGVAVIHSFSAKEADEANDLASDIAALGGTPVTTSATQTLTSKSIDLASNTVTATAAQLNSAISDADVATLAGAETLTNKTLTSPDINGGDFSAGTIEGVDTADYPRGILGVATATSDQAAFTTETDLTGLTKTVTVGTSRQIKITAQVTLQPNTSHVEGFLYLYEGASIVQTTRFTGVGSLGDTVPLTLVHSPSAGSHTYKLAAEVGGGTITPLGNSARPNLLLIEDIGAA